MFVCLSALCCIISPKILKKSKSCSKRYFPGKILKTGLKPFSGGTPFLSEDSFDIFE
jgi:hypothetical protein